MSSRTDRFEYVGFWTRVLATLIDALLGICIFPIHISLSHWGVEQRTVLPDVIFYLGWTALMVWCVIRFGGTPGKLLVGIRIVDGSGVYLILSRALRREIFPNCIISAVSIVQMSTAYATYPESAARATLYDVGTIVNDYGQPYTTLMTFVSWFVLLDIGVILLNRKKRAIHDFIAGSYVITKQSYLGLNYDSPDCESGDPEQETGCDRQPADGGGRRSKESAPGWAREGRGVLHWSSPCLACPMGSARRASPGR